MKRKGPGGARPGAGRPPLLAGGRSVIKTIKLTPDELADQERAASDLGLTWTDWARGALALAVVSGSVRDAC